ncbi:MAG TPA: ATP-grasp domain-containing protein [Patescibacteria group bacterium]|nr:ATP-grasp domain-containing protein [Patescibacteria group bacterium]
MVIGQKLSTTELLYKRAAQMGLQPSWLRPGGLFVIETTDGEKYINSSRNPLNSHVSSSLAKNKYLTRLICQRHGLPNIPFALPQTAGQAEDFLKQHQTIVVKPVGGSGSQDIHIVSDMSQLSGLNIQEYIFEKYVTGKELRYLILNDEVIAVHESEYGASVKEDRSLQRISYPVSDWCPELVAMSLNIVKILGMKFAAVDYIIDAQNKAFILEVNSAPGLKWFHAPTSGPPVDVASMFLDAILAEVKAKVASRPEGPELGLIPTQAYS